MAGRKYPKPWSILHDCSTRKLEHVQNDMSKLLDWVDSDGGNRGLKKNKTGKLRATKDRAQTRRVVLKP
jgi:hypothetical protein